jgi:hypothetical protein
METCTSLAALHGYLSGDGYVIKNPPTQKQKYYLIALRNTEEKLLLDFQEKFEEIFMEIPHISKDKDRCYKGSNLIYEFFTERFGSFYSREWSIPKMTKKCEAIWLRSFFDCEGWVVNIASKNRNIGLDSINHTGLREVARILKDDFSIDTKLHQPSNRDTLRLLIYGRKNLVRFKQHIGFLHPKKKLKLQQALDSFDPWKWNLSDREEVAKIIQEKVKFRVHGARIFSRKENLEKMKPELSNLVLNQKSIGIRTAKELSISI